MGNFQDVKAASHPPTAGAVRGDGRLPLPAAAPLERSWTEAEAFDYCRTLTRSHYENFPVGSVLIPINLQPAIHSLYAFMRTADDFSDEDRKAGDEAERMSWLDTWEAMLSDCEEGKVKHPIFIALRSTLNRYPLPTQWLRDLLHAFKMDVAVRRYSTAEELMTYCRYSANPVGRLILTLNGYRDEERYAWSDAICTGLQLANHWQDVAVDLKKNRIYLPEEDMRRFDLTDNDLIGLQKPSSPAVSGGGPIKTAHGPPTKAFGGDDKFRFQRLLAFEVARARQLFDKGRPLLDHVRGRLRWELRLTWHGGVRILEKIEEADFDIFTQRPVVTKMDWAKIAAKCLL